MSKEQLNPGTKHLLSWCCWVYSLFISLDNFFWKLFRKKRKKNNRKGRSFQLRLYVKEITLFYVTLYEIWHCLEKSLAFAREISHNAHLDQPS